MQPDAAAMRSTLRFLLLMSILCATALLGGCAQWTQNPDEALQRPPGRYLYDDPVSATLTAPAHWEFAVLSENAYQDILLNDELAKRMARQGMSAAEIEKLRQAKPNRAGTPIVCVPAGWRRWHDFPSDATEFQALRQGLHVQVWEHDGPPRRVAVVFRGTEFFDLHDWTANFRWFLRFVPGFEDQYMLVANRVGHEVSGRLRDRFATRPGELLAVELYAAGHSLGGGLAQHFAYALPIDGDHARTPRVKKVFAFNSSPVTGWFSVDADLREANARDLATQRVFEHGEALAYVRLALSYLVPPFLREKAPAITEIRYDFQAGGNVISNHSMRRLALGLADTMKQPGLPPCTPPTVRP